MKKKQAIGLLVLIIFFVISIGGAVLCSRMTSKTTQQEHEQYHKELRAQGYSWSEIKDICGYCRWDEEFGK